MTVAIIGTNGMTLLGRRQVWSRTNGNGIRLVYRGPMDKAIAFYNGKINDTGVDEITIDAVQGVGQVEITVQDDTTSPELNAIWEVVGDQYTTDIRAHPSFNADADQQELENTRQAFERGDVGYAPAGATAELYQKMLLRGVEEWQRSYVTLQQSIRVAPRSTYSAVWTGVDRAWTLNGETGSPNPPTEILGQISDMPDLDTTKKQWLKGAPQTRQISRRQYSIVYQWMFCRRWSYTLYGGDNEDGNP